ncbi:MAG TPA: ABC transporter substrate-binding protein [Acidimicrobiales bacterium]|nr:ABC transporter substrate-binding protein [Acidimicrobiales bacterium]
MNLDTFRRWLHVAPSLERAVTAAVTALVMAVVAWALVPAPPERPLDQLGGGLGAAPEPGVADFTDTGPTTEGSLPTTADGSHSVGPSLPGDARGSSTAGGPGGTSSPGRGTTGGASGSSPPQRLTATDRGVTASAIKVGFAVIDWSGANSLGFFPEMRADVSKAVDAMVDYANQRGGVLGRRIQPVKVTPDLTNEADQRQKCLELTETHGVFAVMSAVAFPAQTATACITTEHKTFLLSGNPGSSAHVRAGYPYDVAIFKDDNRKMRDLVSAASSNGFFDPAKGFRKLGVFVITCATTAHVDAPDGLKAYLREAGIKEWSEYRPECTAQGGQRSGPEAVLQFQQDGVTHVFIASNPPPAEALVNAAGRAGFHPKWFVGDYFNLIVGPFTHKFHPEAFDGALGVTQTHAGEGVVGKPLAPTTQTCSKILTDHGLAPISSAPPKDLGEDMEILQLCEQFLLFLEVAKAAGPQLTRSSWAAALPTIGDFDGALSDLSRFDRRGKTTGGDTMKLVTWKKDCTCFKELSGFRPAPG